MSGAGLFGVCGAALVAIGFYGLVAQAPLVRRVLGFNMMGSGIFLFFGSLAARGSGPVDPVPQAMVITGIVVGLAGTALALVLVARLHAQTGSDRLPDEAMTPNPGHKAADGAARQAPAGSAGAAPAAGPHG